MSPTFGHSSRPYRPEQRAPRPRHPSTASRRHRTGYPSLGRRTAASPCPIRPTCPLREFRLEPEFAEPLDAARKFRGGQDVGGIIGQIAAQKDPLDHCVQCTPCRLCLGRIGGHAGGRATFRISLCGWSHPQAQASSARQGRCCATGTSARQSERQHRHCRPGRSHVASRSSECHARFVSRSRRWQAWRGRRAQAPSAERHGPRCRRPV